MSSPDYDFLDSTNTTALLVDSSFWEMKEKRDEGSGTTKNTKSKHFLKGWIYPEKIAEAFSGLVKERSHKICFSWGKPQNWLFLRDNSPDTTLHQTSSSPALHSFCWVKEPRHSLSRLFMHPEVEQWASLITWAHSSCFPGPCRLCSSQPCVPVPGSPACQGAWTGTKFLQFITDALIHNFTFSLELESLLTWSRKWPLSYRREKCLGVKSKAGNGHYYSDFKSFFFP